MPLRDWISGKLFEDEDGRPTIVRDAASDGAHGLIVSRDGLPTSYVFCADASDTEPFAPVNLAQAREEMPDLEFVVVTRRGISNETYADTDQLGVAIGGLNALRNALQSHTDIGDFRSKNHNFVRSRLDANRYVTSWSRRGYDAYELVRSQGLRSLIVITINPYEVTQEEVYRLINEHAELAVDAIVTTNPNCTGFSHATLEATANAGLQIMTIEAFLSSLGDEWTD